MDDKQNFTGNDESGNAYSRTELIHIIEAQRVVIAELGAKVSELSGGLNLKGWWCICDIFNGEEKEKRNKCRSCGLAKTVRQ